MSVALFGLAATLFALGLGAAPAQAAKPPKVGGCRVFPAFKGLPHRSLRGEPGCLEPERRQGADRPQLQRLRGPDHGSGRQPGGPSRLRGQRPLRDPVHHGRPRPAQGPGEGDRLPGRERLRACADPAAGAGGERLRPPRPRPPAPPLRPVRAVRRPLRRRARAPLEGGLDRALRPPLEGASRGRLDLGRRGGPADPARAGALRRGPPRATSATRSGPPSPRRAAPTSIPPPTTPRANAIPTCRRWGFACG